MSSLIGWQQDVDYSNHVYIVDVSKSPYLVKGTGTDESAKLQAAFDAAAALKATTGGRVMVEIPPGLAIYTASTALVLQENIDFSFRGSSITTLAAKPITLGRAGYENQAEYDLGDISRNTTTANDRHLAADSCAVIIYNYRGKFARFGTTIGFRYDITLWANKGVLNHAWYNTYCNIHLGEHWGKYNVRIRNEDAGSFSNALQFYGGSLSIDRRTHGQCAGVIFEVGATSDGDSIAFMDNNFHGTTIQKGNLDGSEPAWTSGGTVSSTNVGACYLSGGWSYQVVAAGTFGTTAPHLQTGGKTVGTTLTNGSVTLLVEGPFVRVPFLLRNCGSSLRFRDGYIESGVGGLVFLEGKNAGSGGEFIGVTMPISQSNSTRLVMDRTGYRSQYFSASDPYNYWANTPDPCKWRFEFTNKNASSGQSPVFYEQALKSENWHGRAIKGKDGVWTCPGLVGRHNAAITNAATTDWELAEGFIFSRTGDGNNGLGVVVDVRVYKRLEVSFARLDNEQGVSSGIHFLALDDNFTPISLSTDETQPPELYCHYGTLDTIDGVNSWVKLSNNQSNVIAIGDTVKFLLISQYWGNVGSAFDGIEIKFVPDRWDAIHRPVAFKELQTPSGAGRFSYDTPIEGDFPLLGEFIQNRLATSSADSVLGWYVSSIGALCPYAHTAGQTVRIGTRRTNAGNVYVATTAGTCGSTHPTGTGTAISDGTGGVTWRYKCPAAVLTPNYTYNVPALALMAHDYSDSAFSRANFTLGTDTDADGFSDGFTINDNNWGDLTGITLTGSVSGGVQTVTQTFASQNNGGRRTKVSLDDTVANGHTIMIVIKAHGMQAGGKLEILDSESGGPDAPANGFYMSVGSVLASQTVAADSSGDIEFCWMFTAGDYPRIWFETIPNTFTPTYPVSCPIIFDAIFALDLTTVDATLGTGLLSKTMPEIYGIVKKSLFTVPPTSIALTDTATGAKQAVSVANGQLQPTPSLPTATGSVKGGVKIGSSMQMYGEILHTLPTLRLEEIQYKAVQGAYGNRWSCPGLLFTTNYYTASARVWGSMGKLCAGGITLASDWASNPCLIVDARYFRKFAVQIGGPAGWVANTHYFGLDSNFNKIAIASGDITSSAGGSYDGTNKLLATTANGSAEIVTLTNSSIKYLLIAIGYWNDVAKPLNYFKVQGIYTGAESGYDHFGFVDRFLTGSLDRISQGVPLQGHFLTWGEFVADGSTYVEVGEDWGVQVVVPGMKAPAYATGQSIIDGEFRAASLSLGANVYQAVGNFTSTTAPTGTGSGITDGTGAWNYVSTVATLRKIMRNASTTAIQTGGDV